jgi:prepilin-type processing-associated H-X9-DG protein
MTISVRHALVGLAATALLAAPARAAVNPLDRVPADAGLFAHLEAGDLWNHPAVSSLRKAYPKEIEKALQTVETETGLRPEQIDRITFHWPKLPMGPGDEALFVLQVTTKAPYAKDTLLKGLRPKDAKAGGDLIPLREKMVLQLTTDRQFTVLHESLLGEFQKGASKTTDGVLADALKTARAGKHALVVGFDPSGLPAEIFTAAPPELQPFLPLLKSRSITLTADLDKDLTASLRFAQENEDKAIDAERSFNLLMKLADDAITTGLGDGAREKDFEALKPALTEVQKAVRRVKAKRTGTTVTAEASLRADPLLAKPIVQLFLKPQMASARARSSNNLKQIGLAMHNYHDMNGVFPAAAIVNKKGKPLLSWRVAILPYIEQENLYKQFKLDEPWDSEHNKKLAEMVVKTYVLPYNDSDPKKLHYTNYRLFVGNGAVFDTVQGCKITDIRDGTSNTLMVFEGAESTPWTKPDEIEFDPKKPMAKHLRFQDNSVCNILMCDGSVRAVSSKLSEDILRLLIQKDDGMPIPEFD